MDENGQAGKLIIDLEQLTLGDLEEIERLAGADAMGQLFSGQIRASVLVPLLYVYKRKSDPAYTIEDARAVKVTELDVDLREPNPTERGASG